MVFLPVEECNIDEGKNLGNKFTNEEGWHLNM